MEIVIIDLEAKGRKLAVLLYELLVENDDGWGIEL
jgi:hypothetical protein